MADTLDDLKRNLQSLANSISSKLNERQGYLDKADEIQKVYDRLARDKKTIKDDDTFTVMCLAIKKHMEPFLSLEGDLFEGGDTLVKDTWINYVLGDDAVLAKPEPYITLR